MSTRQVIILTSAVTLNENIMTDKKEEFDRKIAERFSNTREGLIKKK